MERQDRETSQAADDSVRRRALRESLLIGTVGLLTISVGLFGLWISATSSIRDNYRHGLVALAQAAAAQIDPVLHAQLRNPADRNGPLYNRVIAPLRRMRDASTDIRYIYTMVLDGGAIRFVLDTGTQQEYIGKGLEDQAGLWEPYTDAKPESYAIVRGDLLGDDASTPDPQTDAWGSFMTGWAPILDSEHHRIGVVGVDVNANVYIARLSAARRWALLGILPSALLLFVIATVYYRQRVRGLSSAASLADAARRDKLTGLANRAHFMERLQQEVTQCKRGEHRLFAVLFLDFDRFKVINDTLGHDAGDELLQQIALRLRATLRDWESPEEDTREATIARFGGDEFLVFIRRLRATSDAKDVANRMQEALTPAYTLHGRTVNSTASIGIVTSDQCREDAETIVACADAAMYEAKRAGVAHSVVFTDSMHIQFARRIRIERDLRGAIGTSQLFLVYQPIVDLHTGAMASVEALLRWIHPELGGIPPSEFVPVAEQSGLIIELAEWVLPEACRMLADWRIRDPAGAPRSVSVNVSRAELKLGQRLLSRVREALSSTGLPPQCLQLEITEHRVMQDPEDVQPLLLELRGLGLRLAMDDFGTGGSSLGCLRHYPFDAIKVDRSFLLSLDGDSDGLAVIHAMFTLIENLGKISVAEGIEDASQVAMLQSVGCRYGQGHFFGRPVRADKLSGFAASGEPSGAKDRNMDTLDEIAEEAPRRLGGWGGHLRRGPCNRTR